MLRDADVSGNAAIS